MRSISRRGVLVLSFFFPRDKTFPSTDLIETHPSTAIHSRREEEKKPKHISVQSNTKYLSQFNAKRVVDE